MIRKLDDKSMSQGKNKNISKETQQGITYSTIFFFIKPKEDFKGGTMAAKTSPPLCGRSGVAGTRTPEELSTGAPEELGTEISEELGVGATEELVPDDRLLQRDQDQSQNKKKVSTTGKQENNSPTSNKGSIIVLFCLVLDQGCQSTS